MIDFLKVFLHYLIEILPVLLIGLVLSGIVNEFVSARWVEKHLAKKGLKPILYSTFVGTLLPLCCVGCLPVAISFHKKGARMGPILAFLVATPITSITALLVCYKFLGLKFTLYLFGCVVLLALAVGMLGNFLPSYAKHLNNPSCPHCIEVEETKKIKKKFWQRLLSIFKFSFFDMVKEMGPELLLGLALASAVMVIAPIGNFVKYQLGGFWGYPFATGFGLVMYICATGGIPLVHGLLQQGLNIGAGVVLLLIGPVTNFSGVLIIRKEFGLKTLLFYLTITCAGAICLGVLFTTL